MTISDSRKEGDTLTNADTTTSASDNATAIVVSLSSNEVGKHAELLAQTALLANGYEVSEPISPLPYDLVVRNPATRETVYVQIKTAFLRDEKRYGGKYLVVRGAKNNGDVYAMNEVDSFIAVWHGDVYIFPNREKSEYWIKPEHVDDKWTKLGMTI